MSRPFPISATLTAIAIGYRNSAAMLIGGRALPALSVHGELFKWSEYPMEEGFTLPQTKVGRKGRVNKVEFTMTEREASIDDYGLDDEIPYSDIEEAARQRAEKRSLFDPRAATTEGLTNLIGLDREVRVANVVQDPNNYAADKKIVLSGSDRFSDPASDIYGIIDDGFNKTLVYRPNTIVMGMAVWSKVKRNPRLIKAVKGGLTEDGAITRAQFAELFELKPENILVGEALLNTARKGQSATMSRVWGKSMQLIYLDSSKQTSNDSTITWGFSAELGGRIAGSIEDKDIGLQGGERVRVGERVKEMVVAKHVGYQIQNAVA